MDILKGGEADGIPDSSFPKSKLYKGLQHESEHTNNPLIAKEIAKDHLVEDKNYYTKLTKLEKLVKESYDLLDSNGQVIQSYPDVWSPGNSGGNRPGGPWRPPQGTGGGGGLSLPTNPTTRVPHPNSALSLPSPKLPFKKPLRWGRWGAMAVPAMLIGGGLLASRMFGKKTNTGSVETPKPTNLGSLAGYENDIAYGSNGMTSPQGAESFDSVYGGLSTARSPLSSQTHTQQQMANEYNTLRNPKGYNKWYAPPAGLNIKTPNMPNTLPKSAAMKDWRQLHQVVTSPPTLSDISNTAQYMGKSYLNSLYGRLRAVMPFLPKVSKPKLNLGLSTNPSAMPAMGALKTSEAKMSKISAISGPIQGSHDLPVAMGPGPGINLSRVLAAARRHKEAAIKTSGGVSYGMWPFSSAAPAASNTGVDKATAGQYSAAPETNPDVDQAMQAINAAPADSPLKAPSRLSNASTAPKAPQTQSKAPNAYAGGIAPIAVNQALATARKNISPASNSPASPAPALNQALGAPKGNVIGDAATSMDNKIREVTGQPRAGAVTAKSDRVTPVSQNSGGDKGPTGTPTSSDDELIANFNKGYSPEQLAQYRADAAKSDGSAANYNPKPAVNSQPQAPTAPAQPPADLGRHYAGIQRAKADIGTREAYLNRRLNSRYASPSELNSVRSELASIRNQGKTRNMQDMERSQNMTAEDYLRAGHSPEAVAGWQGNGTTRNGLATSTKGWNEQQSANAWRANNGAGASGQTAQPLTAAPHTGLVNGKAGPSISGLASKTPTLGQGAGGVSMAGGTPMPKSPLGPNPAIAGASGVPKKLPMMNNPIGIPGSPLAKSGSHTKAAFLGQAMKLLGKAKPAFSAAGKFYNNIPKNKWLSPVVGALNGGAMGAAADQVAGLAGYDTDGWGATIGAGMGGTARLKGVSGLLNKAVPGLGTKARQAFTMDVGTRGIAGNLTGWGRSPISKAQAVLGMAGTGSGMLQGFAQQHGQQAALDTADAFAKQHGYNSIDELMNSPAAKMFNMVNRFTGAGGRSAAAPAAQTWNSIYRPTQQAMM